MIIRIASRHAWTRASVHPPRCGRGFGGARDESGFAIVLVAFSLVVILGVAAVAIDLGTGYASSRQVQNASDSAALQATQVLECYDIVSNTNSPIYNPAAASQYNCPTTPYVASDVYNKAAEASVQENGASSVTVCKIISYYGSSATAPYYSVVDPDCRDTAGWDTSSSADGVYVESNGSQATSFAKTLGRTSVTENRQSAATVQSLLGISGSGTFLVCYSGQQDTTAPGDNVPPLVTFDSASNQYVLNTTQATTIGPPLGSNGKPTYNGPVYSTTLNGPIMQIWGPGSDTCNTGSSGFKGLGCVAGAQGSHCAQGAGTTPADFTYKTGDKAGPTRTSIAGQPNCTPTDISNGDACVMILPICIGPGSSSKTLYCVAIGAFELKSATSNSADFAFLGAATAAGGQSSSGGPSGSSVLTIELVQ